MPHKTKKVRELRTSCDMSKPKPPEPPGDVASIRTELMLFFSFFAFCAFAATLGLSPPRRPPRVLQSARQDLGLLDALLLEMLGFRGSSSFFFGLPAERCVLTKIIPPTHKDLPHLSVTCVNEMKLFLIDSIHNDMISQCWWKRVCAPSLQGSLDLTPHSLLHDEASTTINKFHA